MAASSPADPRDLLRSLLDMRSPLDGLARYYIFHYDPKRVSLNVHLSGPDRADGFLLRAQTGFDLFRPLVTFRAASREVALELIRDGLPAGRPIRLTIPADLAAWAMPELDVTDAEVMRVYANDPTAFEPEINVLVTTGRSPEGFPRAEIRSGESVHASAGLNWRTENFAEVFVYTEAAARGRGWGRSVLSVVVGALIRDRVRPLCVVEENNTASIRLAEGLGFRDTGLREFAANAVRRIAESSNR